jgi:hypothetical protein
VDHTETNDESLEPRPRGKLEAMKETRGGALTTTIAGLILLLVAGGGWAGRRAWNRYQFRTSLAGAFEAYDKGDLRQALELLDRAGKRMDLSTLPPGAERDRVRAIWIREAYDEQLTRDLLMQLSVGKRPPDPRALRDECRRLRLPCPLVLEFVADLISSHKLR